jgi:hypothetical protein
MMGNKMGARHSETPGSVLNGTAEPVAGQYSIFSDLGLDRRFGDIDVTTDRCSSIAVRCSRAMTAVHRPTCNAGRWVGTGHY